MFELIVLASMLGQTCGPNGCTGGAPYVQPSFIQPSYTQPAYVPPAKQYEWRATNDPDQMGLFLNDRYIGAWSYSRKRMAAKTETGWTGWVYDSPPVDCPKPPERNTDKDSATTIPIGDWKTSGVDTSRVPSKRSFSINGHDASESRVVEALGFDGSSLPNDSNYLRITAIGPKAVTDQVEKDVRMSETFAPYRSSVLFQAYEPTDVMVQGVGAKGDGNPTIYVQAPNGKVLHRQDDYSGGIGSLTEAVRKAKDGYVSGKDPNLNGFPGLDVIWAYLKGLPSGTIINAGILALLVFYATKLKGPNPAPAK